MDLSVVKWATMISEIGDQFLRDCEMMKYVDEGIEIFGEKVCGSVRALRHSIVFYRKPTEREIIDQLIVGYIAHHWRVSKTIYNFSPDFLDVLAQTSDTPIYADVFLRLPFRDFVMNTPKGSEFSSMFVHIEFGERADSSPPDVLIAILPFNGNANSSNDIDYDTHMAWCRDGKRIIESYRHCIYRKNKSSVDLDEEYNNIDKPAPDEKYFVLAAFAAYYLASKNADIKELRIPKEERPVVQAKKPGAKPKRAKVNAYEIGYAFAQSYERQMAANEYARKSVGTGTRTGRTVRPHMRRAHWHHYWTGPGRESLEVRWIQPTLVLANGEQEMPFATIQKVNGNMGESG